MTKKTYKYELFNYYPGSFYGKPENAVRITIETANRANTKAFIEEVKVYEKEYDTYFEYYEYKGGRYMCEPNLIKFHLDK